MIPRCDITGNPIGQDIRPPTVGPCRCRTCTAERRKQPIQCIGFRAYGLAESDYICSAMLRMGREVDRMRGDA